jgi:predicted permease
MLQTLRQSARLLLKSPGATLAALASLALGIGANTTIFSLIDAVVLRPLAVSQSDRLVAIADANQLTVPYPVYQDFAAATRTLKGLAAFAPRTGSVTVSNESTVGDIHVVSGNYFSVLGVGAAVGRPLSPADDRAGSEPVVVLSSAFWRQAFGGDPGVVGRRVFINGGPFTVCGVAPETFKGTTVGARPYGWISIASWPRMATGVYLQLSIHNRGWGWLRMVGRLQDRIEPEQVSRELNQLARAQAREHSTMPSDFGVAVTPLRAAATGVRSRADLTRFVALLVAVVLAVLGIACANVSGLLLARGLARRRELAVRMALGASRRRVARDLLTEALLLGTAGALLGVLVAMWAIELLRRVQLPGNIDMSRVDVGISGMAIAATAGLSLVAALLFGLAPVFQATRRDVLGALKDQPIAGRASRQFLRGSLVALQVTFSLVLLVGTLLFARALQTTLSSDLGFNPRNVAYAATNVSLQRYDASRAATFYQDVLARMRATPSVSAAAWTRLIPSGDRDTETADIPGYASPDGRRPIFGVNVVTSGYFEAMGIPIFEGRGFRDSDTREAPAVVVVSQSAAARYWNGDAIGRRFSIQDREVTIVGVARDVPLEPGVEARPFVYGNVLQAGGSGAAFLIVRTRNDPADIVPAMTDAIRSAGPTVPVLEARTMEEQLLDLLGPQRSAAALLALLSVIALVLSAAGIYAMVGFWVTQRTREFGVRMALGATAGGIRALALRHAAGAVAAGAVLGLPLSIALGRASERMLYGVKATDPIALGAGVVLLLAMALAASLVPAQRAASSNPLSALRAGTE